MNDEIFFKELSRLSGNFSELSNSVKSISEAVECIREFANSAIDLCNRYDLGLHPRQPVDPISVLRCLMDVGFSQSQALQILNAIAEFTK